MISKSVQICYKKSLRKVFRFVTSWNLIKKSSRRDINSLELCYRKLLRINNLILYQSLILNKLSRKVINKYWCLKSSLLYINSRKEICRSRCSWWPLIWLLRQISWHREKDRNKSWWINFLRLSKNCLLQQEENIYLLLLHLLRKKKINGVKRLQS